ncbi:putative xyloglucan endotransglucosylase/hydrolase protein 1 [Impatiens glandulifera]|uniref:putative xyloglucan endotransglucosylase/hydrolase protein 1 n=1 Tax=Impatiens glandulifera TaxID=253017 RepID=UPI001FB1482A|nr:putative xyloglucan endotransglucosylase/hydrolase protein 1 [Impatiens glandulifera]
MGLIRESLIIMVLGVVVVMSDEVFDKYYEPFWGFDHLSVTDQGKEVQILIDATSGAGFKSKQEYCSGIFRMQIKISEKLTGGIVTSFYLISSNKNEPKHDEIDFEFIGTKGKFQTNVFVNDPGHREELVNLWFNPSAAFHTYEINWNPQQILFKIDNKTVRTFIYPPNYISRPLHVEGTVWNGSWAGAVDWSKAPFTSSYRGFYIQGTPCNK